MTTRVALQPGNRAAWLGYRALDITSTESAALFPAVGCPYCTRFELHHRKASGTVVDLEPNERMDWGTDLQDSIALSFAKRYGVKVARITEYMRIPEVRMGASFDFEIVGIEPYPNGEASPLVTMFERHGPGLLEIKNVDRSIFAEKWVKRVSDEEGEPSRKIIEPPGYIDIQLQQQLHIRGRAWGAIGVLVGGNTGRLVLRERDKAVGRGLEAVISAFWKSVDEGIAPPPVFPGDADVVKALYGTSASGMFDGRGNADLDTALDAYKEALAREKLAAEDKRVAQAKALMIVGGAERAYSDRYTVSAGMVAEAEVAYVRKPYRGWRVTEKKGA